MPNALLSVSSKQNLVELAQGLAQLGWGLLASGGTAAAIRKAGLAVEEIADYTGSPEILGGRVKTLHPAVHGGILARATGEDLADLERIHARMIDLVVVNLYPFQETINRPGVSLEDAIENIDIGGVALIRAAAKNFQRTAVATDPEDYASILAEIQEQGQITLAMRKKLAIKAFQHTAGYDSAITTYLASALADTQPTLDIPAWLAGYPFAELRYGENPHQQARLYHLNPQAGALGGEVLQGKALSYNNLLDLDSAWRAALAFEKPTIAIIKHLSPCGIASASSLIEAFQLALESDPVSAYGGVIAANRPFDRATADALGSLFVECIIAPDFTPQAVEKLAGRKNCRLVRVADTRLQPSYEIRSVNQGLLLQSRDFGDPESAGEWQVVTERQPTAEEWAALRFAWKACMHVKSNAIVLGQREATVGIGGGQPNRVDCVKIAIERAGAKASGSVMASDAFFPFRDSVEMAASAGVTAIVEPGGSMRDAESIAAANAANIAMVFSGTRHFRH
jgi:phosphoribosylaminoimidazolecarboxamide formyltransferase / IMP cyclohydrolase